jgi:hypothetical protein
MPKWRSARSQERRIKTRGGLRRQGETRETKTVKKKEKDRGAEGHNMQKTF